MLWPVKAISHRLAAIMGQGVKEWQFSYSFTPQARFFKFSKFTVQARF